MPTKKGVTAFWYLDSAVLATANAARSGTNGYASASGTMNFQSMSGTRKSKKATLETSGGITKGEAFTDDMTEGTFTGKPSGASLAAAKTVNILPPPGSIVTFTDTDDVYIGSDFTIDESGWSGDNASAREITIKFHKSNDYPQLTDDAV